MNHYYTNNDHLESQERILNYEYHHRTFRFISDLGVFSKNGIDYGSRVLLDSFEKPLADVSLLDVGCGYGTLGIMLAGVGSNIQLTMVDVNDRALQLARRNARQNNISCTVLESSCYDGVGGTFDYIISNPPIRAGKKIVHEILSGAYDHLNQHGKLRVVIQKKQGAPSAKKKMMEVFGNCEVICKDKGYYILEATKGSC